MYALFKNDKQISKAHSTKRAIEIEALELGIIGYGARRIFWPSDYSIKLINNPNDEATK